MICPKCGKDAGEVKFCPECGEPLEIPAVEAESVANEQSREEESLGLAVEEIDVCESEPKLQQHVKNKKKLFVIAAVLTVVLAAVIAVVCVQSRKINIEKEVINSHWIQKDSSAPIELYFTGKTVTISDGSGNKQTYDWEKRGDNYIEVTQEFLGTSFSYLTLEMAKEKGKVIIKTTVETDEGNALQLIFQKNKSAEESKTDNKLLETTTETVTKKEYPPAEDFDPFSIVSYEKNNAVKRNKYLEEVKSKRYVFYFEVNEIKGEHEAEGKLYPSDAFVIDESLGQDAYATFYLGKKQNLNGLTTEEKYVYMINFLFWNDSFSSVTFDDEIWETLEKGDRLTIEGSITESSKLEMIGWNVDIENAVIASKATSD